MDKDTYILAFVGLLLSTTSTAQSTSKNYVLERRMLDANESRSITAINYYDDLGYPEETATNGLSGNGKYAFTLQESNFPGRVTKEWTVGATSPNGNYMDASSIATSATALLKDAMPYSTYEYDALGRVVSTIGPGENWHKNNKAINKEYGANDANSVKLYEVSSAGSLVAKGYYPANALSSEKTTDEDGCSVETFTDLYGHKVLERRSLSNDTYYIYDNIGRLRFVLSPSYQEESNLQKFAYEYRYDDRGRCIWKRLPGCEYQQLWYDNGDKLMFSQDGEQRKKGIYLFYAYDFLKRQVLLGTTTAINAACTSAIATYTASASGICNTGYVGKANMGLRNEQLLIANYYDRHDFINGSLVKQATNQNLASDLKAVVTNSRGFQTGTISKDTDGELLVSVFYHSIEGLVVESKETLPGKALLCQRTTYTYTKKPATITSTITKGSVSKNIVQTNSYNPNNDMIGSIALTMDGVSKTVATYTYDDLGRLAKVNRSGNAGQVSNEYNVRGWLSSINSQKFHQALSYEKKNGKEPCFNGNISRMQWSTAKDNILRGYDFEYDKLNRLTSSLYAEGNDMSQNKDRYSENILSYSPNGSIEKLQRYGKKNNATFGLIDDLTYSYNGNQIKAISDKAGSLLYNGSFDFKDGANADTEYFYDANGALTKDLNKGISNIEYDILGNLKCITFGNGNKTKYVYDASGIKLRTIHESAATSTTDYAGNFIFENGRLSKYLFEGGFCLFDSSLKPTYHYYEKDHLGSIRMVVNESGAIEQVNHYYPFGGILGDLSYNSEFHRNKYIGKELDHTDGLDWYDHGARMYDAAKGSWDRIDNSAEKYVDTTPYSYSHNNPINKLDMDGNDDYFSNTGVYLYSIGNNPNIYIFQGSKAVNFNQFDLRKRNNLVVGARVVGYYARKAGVKYDMNGGEGHVGISTLHGTDDLTGAPLAQTLGNSIYLKMTNGKLNEEMYNSYNVLSTIGHENIHKESNEELSFYSHSQIVLKQISDASFAKTTSHFQTGTIRYLVWLMNKSVDNGHPSGLMQIMILANKSIKTLNKGKIVKRNKHYEYEY